MLFSCHVLTESGSVAPKRVARDEEAIPGMRALSRIQPLASTEDLAAAGFRCGDKGTQTSRTIMLAEIGELLEAVPASAGREAYGAAIVDENVLGKQTLSTRRLTKQRLSELYGLDPRFPIFRVFRRLWPIDAAGRPLLAMLVALDVPPENRTR